MLRLLILASILFLGCNQDNFESNMIKKEGMVLIPSGSFLMGSEEKFSRKDDELVLILTQNRIHPHQNYHSHLSRITGA